MNRGQKIGITGTVVSDLVLIVYLSLGGTSALLLSIGIIAALMFLAIAIGHS